MSLLCQQVNIPFKALVEANGALCDDDDYKAQGFRIRILQILKEDKNTAKIFNRYGAELIQHQQRLKEHDETITTSNELVLFNHLNLAENWPRFRSRHRAAFWKHIDQLMLVVSMVGATSAGGNRSGIENLSMNVVERMAKNGSLHNGPDVDPWEVANDALEQLTEGNMVGDVANLFKVDDVGAAAGAMRALGIDPAAMLPPTDQEELRILEEAQARGEAPLVSETSFQNNETPSSSEAMDERLARLTKTINDSAKAKKMKMKKKKKKKAKSRRRNDSDSSSSSSDDSDSDSDSDRDSEKKRRGQAGPQSLFDNMFKKLAGNPNFGGGEAMSEADKSGLQSMFGKMSTDLFANNGMMEKVQGMGGGGSSSKAKKQKKKSKAAAATEEVSSSEEDQVVVLEDEDDDDDDDAPKEDVAAVADDAKDVDTFD